MDLNEENIWKNIQKKNVQTFERYYHDHYKRFFMMACKYTKDPLQAEEIVNDVFIKLWQDGEKINIETSLKSYIYRAVINRSINAVHKNKMIFMYESDTGFLPDDSYELRQMEENELKIKLFSAIDQLAPQCKKVFEMSRFEELKQQEIADELGISIKTVKNHITIALKQLGSLLEDYLIGVILLLIQFFSVH